MRPDLPCQGSARVSAGKREVTQHLPGRRPCNQPRTAAPPALPTAPLDWTTPSCTLPRAPTRKGGLTCGGSPLRPRPSSGQRRKHLGSKRNGAHRPPWNKTRQPTGRVFIQRARRHPPPSIIDPSRNPARATIERGAASAQAIAAAHALGGRWTPESKTRTPPDISGSDETTVNGRAPAEGHTARATAQVYTDTAASHSHQPPQRIKRIRAGNGAYSPRQPAAHQVEQRRRRFTKRATPSADRTLTGRAAGTPQGSEEARGADTMKTPP
ncbi:hypothetical protein WOLCODRAFT_159290 [Wolfiporia cocos MD-104 SS10]|uniref:Uncharacterized protein n=1 Tax=Wolfiporia cocos (strain MD-104) TaxID=742152 RepID=A0A2H3JL80_WOLCO|nr:hypothetical protein WOLCODRAFT_159290 [Wolfiporia cocos MD-104 SS10]